MAVLTGIRGLAASRMGSLLTTGAPKRPHGLSATRGAKQLLANSLWSLWIFGDLLGFVPSVAFYLVLRRYNGFWFIGTLFVFFLPLLRRWRHPVELLDSRQPRPGVHKCPD